MTKQTFNHLSDIEVIEKYKSSNLHWETRRDIEEYFYTKFKPCIENASRKYSYIASVEDNMQEAYLMLIHALEWVDPNKITNPSSYSFGSTLKPVLSAYFQNQIKYESYAKSIEKETISLYQQNDRGEDYVIGEVESHEEGVIFNSNIMQFKSILKDGEKKIWELLETGKSQKDIAIQFGKSSVQYQVQKLKAKYIDFMNSNGYSIQC